MTTGRCDRDVEELLVDLNTASKLAGPPAPLETQTAPTIRSRRR